LKSYLENQTASNRGEYVRWNNNKSKRKWRVVTVDISASEIAGNKMFDNFSWLTQVTHLDVSLVTGIEIH
jgi:hypothetical protein